MKCSCIRNQNYDFHIDYSSCYSFIYSDLSEWMTEDQYVIPETYNILITPPECSPVIVTVNTLGATKVSGKELFNSVGILLPDGIYCFKIDNCQEIITKHWALTCKLECRRDNLILQAMTDDDWNNVNTVNSHISAIHAHAHVGNFTEANKEYKFAKRLLENLNCDC